MATDPDETVLFVFRLGARLFALPPPLVVLVPTEPPSPRATKVRGAVYVRGQVAVVVDLAPVLAVDARDTARTGQHRLGQRRHDASASCRALAQAGSRSASRFTQLVVLDIQATPFAFVADEATSLRPCDRGVRPTLVDPAELLRRVRPLIDTRAA
jgi:chemotaxis signal transduction protein